MEQEPKLESFIGAFGSGGGGCVRTCACGRRFYNPDLRWSWEEGELEELEADPAATALGYAVSTVVFGIAERCVDCDCWQSEAVGVMGYLDRYRHSIASYYKNEKERLTEEAADIPEIDSES